MKPKLLERRKVISRVTDKIVDYIGKFMDGVAEPKEGYGKKE